nr:MAG TPA: hypothetical protein [Caudoviricetes sp.]
MMIQNGYINLQLESGGGYDDEGAPVPVIKEWSEPIPAQIAVNTNANVGIYVGGQFTIRSYTIDIEMQKLPDFDTIRIIRHGHIIGYDKHNPLPVDSNGFDPNGAMKVQDNPQYLENVGIIRIGI